MKFTSKKYRSAKYVVEPKDVIVVPGHPKQRVVGLTATFNNFVFDSEEAAKALRWTPEQRMWVEADLLQHGDFGRRHSNVQASIWLVPEGPTVDVMRDISDELEAFQPGLRAEVASKLNLTGENATLPTCAHVITDGEGVRLCKREAQGGAYCSQHAKMHSLDITSDELASKIEAESSAA